MCVMCKLNLFALSPFLHNMNNATNLMSGEGCLNYSITRISCFHFVLVTDYTYNQDRAFKTVNVASKNLFCQFKYLAFKTW